MASDKYKKLLKNSAVFLVGNLGSKIISFFIVPFYTYYLTTAEYGTADLVTTTVNLLVPFAMLGMNEAVLRLSASGEASAKSIATNSMLVVLMGWTVCWALYPLFHAVSIIGDNVFLFLVLLCLTSFNSVFLQLLRGMGKSRAFAVNGVLMTLVMAVANVIALAILHFGVLGYLSSMALAQLVGAIHIIACTRLWRLLSLRYASKVALSGMLHYCMPLIPNSLMWWIMSASDRYVILFFIGTGANGIYNVAQKVPSVVNVVYGVFMQAWQVSAIEERDSEDNTKFQSTVFRYVFMALAVVTSLIAASAYPVYAFLMSSAYEGSWQLVAMLALANLLSCIGSFFGVTYVVTKESKKAFSTTAVGALVNIVFTLMLVPAIGIMGAAAATVISYAVIALVRAKDTRKFVRISFNWAEIIPSLVIVLAQVTLSLFPYSDALLVLDFVLFAALLFVLRNCLWEVAKKSFSMLHHKRLSKNR